MPALAELTPQDLDKIRLIVNEANTLIKTDVAWLQGKMDNLDKQIFWLMVLIVVAVGIPQVVAWRSRKDRETEPDLNGNGMVACKLQVNLGNINFIFLMGTALPTSPVLVDR